MGVRVEGSWGLGVRVEGGWGLGVRVEGGWELVVRVEGKGFRAGACRRPVLYEHLFSGVRFRIEGLGFRGQGVGCGG